MIQTLAIFKDAYRELNAKKMFWIVLILSGLIVAVFASLGINQKGVSFLIWTFQFFGINSDLVPPAEFYKNLFKDYGIGIWLTWIASILALISTASIFPDFIAGGSIELTLSKPIHRFRLFMTKYVAGLLFVALQVTVFSLASFLVIGLRGKFWEPRLFLAIPIVVCLFSYLFSICVVLGLLTRSTVASLLLTLLIWFFFFLLNLGDAIIVQGDVVNSMHREASAAQIARLEAAAAVKLQKEKDPSGDTSEADVRPGKFSPSELDAADPVLPVKRDELAEIERDARRWHIAERIATRSKAIFPKTGETVQLLDRTLKTAEEIEREKKQARDLPFETNGINRREVAVRMQERFRNRTLAWVLGTSLGFEALMLGLGAWIFCRRDF
jgi:ABC-type transport system involved in multi-copper enzyme maturation permease subunit